MQQMRNPKHSNIAKGGVCTRKFGVTAYVSELVLDCASERGPDAHAQRALCMFPTVHIHMHPVAFAVYCAHTVRMCHSLFHVDCTMFAL